MRHARKVGPLIAYLLACVSVTAATAANVSGTVTNSSSQGVAGVSITVLHSTTQATTDATGAYTLTNLASGRQIIVPSLAGTVFRPVARQVRVGAEDFTDVNFTASVPVTYAISGAISGAAGVTVSGLTVNLYSAHAGEGHDRTPTLGAFLTPASSSKGAAHGCA